MAELVVRVQPGARRSGFVGWYGELPKLAVASPPVDGAANAEVVRVISRLFGVRPRSVEIVHGATSRTKRLVLREVTADDVATRLSELLPGRN